VSKSQSTASRRIYLLLARMVAEGMPHPRSQNVGVDDTSSVFLRFDSRIADARRWVDKLGAALHSTDPYGDDEVEHDWRAEFEGRRVMILAHEPRPKGSRTLKPDHDAAAIISDALAALTSPDLNDPAEPCDCFAPLTPSGDENAEVSA
jgi:hypothetical protein